MDDLLNHNDFCQEKVIRCKEQPGHRHSPCFVKHKEAETHICKYNMIKCEVDGCTYRGWRFKYNLHMMKPIFKRKHQELMQKQDKKKERKIKAKHDELAKMEEDLKIKQEQDKKVLGISGD